MSIIRAPSIAFKLRRLKSSYVDVSSDSIKSDKAAKILAMLEYYEKLGHFRAATDPLRLPPLYPLITRARAANAAQCDNDLASFGFQPEELDLPVDLHVPHTGGLLGRVGLKAGDPPRTVRELHSRLNEIYCGSIGAEFMHLHNRERINWLRDKLETGHKNEYEPHQKREILETVTRAVLFEQFAATKFATVKRFGLDGCEGFMVGLQRLMKTGVLLGMESACMCMAHRGRLNALKHIFGKPGSQLYSEFVGHTGFGLSDSTAWGNAGDVKYHLGAEIAKHDADVDKKILYTLLPNPSHLEAAAPVCLGTARARQDRLRAELTKNSSSSDHAPPLSRREVDERVWPKVLPIIVHGDASVSGQGVVYEVAQMSALPKYAVGGTIHIVINNQIGFTTFVGDGGSGNYPTDVAKCIDAPILHVNADDPEALCRVMEIAAEYRQKFHSDVYVDIVGYRRAGHNELDLPMFTQPHMYALIHKRPNVMELYSQKLVTEKVVTEAQIQELRAKIMKENQEEFEKAKSYKPHPQLRPYNPAWRDQLLPSEYSAPRVTGVPRNRLVELGQDLCTLPDAPFHPTAKRVYKQRLDALAAGKQAASGANAKTIDFGMAESLAFATLVDEGVHIRLMGQDTERGTFSHRHAILRDQTSFETEETIEKLRNKAREDNEKGGENQKLTTSHCWLSDRDWFPLEELKKKHKMTGSVEIGNSLLSEYACLGFEYGYSLESPQILPIWEAQFGDFVNGAQIVLDQFIAAGEAKWAHPTGLVLMLPHGYDGQGSEHSSARLERFLQMCDDREDVVHPENWDVSVRSVVQKHNMQVCNPTTPAQLFHLLRRQIHRGFRKPLIIMAPKRLLRLKEANSALPEFTENTRFRRFMTDPSFEPLGDTHPGILSTSGGDPLPASGGAKSPAVADSQSSPRNAKGGNKAVPTQKLNSRMTVQRLVLCSGQVYYDLIKARDAAGLQGEVMISRVEQISPFPYDHLKNELFSLPYLRSVTWCQEEPMNAGAWGYVKPRIESLIRYTGEYNGLSKVLYAGRDVCAAPASGDHNIHKKELDTLLADALNLRKTSNSYEERYRHSHYNVQ